MVNFKNDLKYILSKWKINWIFLIKDESKFYYPVVDIIFGNKGAKIEFIRSLKKLYFIRSNRSNKMTSTSHNSTFQIVLKLYFSQINKCNVEFLNHHLYSLLKINFLLSLHISYAKVWNLLKEKLKFHQIKFIY